MERQSLIFDADDTLWENNIYFESAFTQFCGYLQHSRLAPLQVREVLDEIEIANVKIHGYGSRNFARSLTQCMQHLAERNISEEDLSAVRKFAMAILEQPMELLPGVQETIADLWRRHELTLFTKGDLDEQRIKVDRSGLGSYFRHVAIVHEKDERAYRRLMEDQGMVPERTWMVGNSPKSDINPALAAGMKAVYIPHPRTWSLEHELVPEAHSGLIRIDNITELRRIF